MSARDDRPGPLAPGDVLLERYQVTQAIATGGHSVVYLGEDARLARPVCIKVFTRYLADAGITRTSYEHFVQEAFALSRLTHPNTLRIYDFGHLPGDDGLPFHVSEYMNGGTLAQLVRERGGQPWVDVGRLTAALGEALTEAHAAGIVHRDLKPQNILFALVGEARLPKLADFGIAKWLEAVDAELGRRAPPRAGDTQVVSGHRMAMYSPSWAAPEQLAGQPIGPATDVYSLALLAVYMLTGRAVFADDDVYEGYRKRRASGELVPAALAPLGLPDRAIEVLRAALAFEPAERPVEAAGFGHALAAAVSPSPRAVTELTSREPTAAPTRPVRPPPRHLTPTAAPLELAGRAARFVTTVDGVADVDGLDGRARLRLTLGPAAGGHHQVHVRGRNCFVARAGGRPSIAVAVDGEAMLDLVVASGAPLGRVRISTGTAAAGHTVFRFGDESVAVAHDDAPVIALVDFGAGAACAFVHAPPLDVPGGPAARGPGKRGKN